MTSNATLQTIRTVQAELNDLRATTIATIDSSLKRLRALERSIQLNDVIIIESDDDSDVTHYDTETMSDDEHMSEDFSGDVKRKRSPSNATYPSKRHHATTYKTPPSKRTIRDVHNQTSVYLNTMADARAKRAKRELTWKLPLF